MALKPLQTMNPYGEFDGKDSELTSLLGGEVVTLGSVDITAADQHASDTKDGYAGTTTKKRPYITKTLASGVRPLFLADEGIAGYGTLFGSLVGGTVGQNTAGTVIGPHSTAGSGKVTVWNFPGLYAVTLDAVDTTASTGLVPTNSTLVPGAALYATTAGKLTPDAGSAFESVVVARFSEFTTNGSLVNTRVDLVSALNSPTGGVAAKMPFVQANIFWGPEL